MRKGDDRVKKNGEKKKIMGEIVATNVVASRPPKVGKTLPGGRVAHQNINYLQTIPTLAPPLLSLPSLKITALSYSWAT